MKSILNHVVQSKCKITYSQQQISSLRQSSIANRKIKRAENYEKEKARRAQNSEKEKIRRVKKRTQEKGKDAIRYQKRQPIMAKKYQENKKSIAQKYHEYQCRKVSSQGVWFQRQVNNYYNTELFEIDQDLERKAFELMHEEDNYAHISDLAMDFVFNSVEECVKSKLNHTRVLDCEAFYKWTKAAP